MKEKGGGGNLLLIRDYVQSKRRKAEEGMRKIEDSNA